MLYIILILFIIVIIFLVMTSYKVYKNDKWNYSSEEDWRRNKKKYYKIKNKKCCLVSGDNRTSEDITLIKDLNQDYCDANGYDFIFYDKEDIDDKYQHKYPPYWWKVAMVYDVMKRSDYDYVMWIDSDACVHDHEVRMERVCPENMIFVMSSDIDIYKLPEKINFTGEFNAGVWIVRNNNKGKRFMKDWLNMYQSDRWYRKGDEWTCKYHVLPCMWAGTYYEQGSCYDLMHSSKYSPYILQLHYNILQGYRNPNEYSYTIHFCGDSKKYIKQYFFEKNITFSK